MNSHFGRSAETESPRTVGREQLKSGEDRRLPGGVSDRGVWGFD